MLHGAAVVQVRGDDLALRRRARAVGGGQRGGARLRVPRDLARLGGAAHRDGVHGRRVAVAVAVVLVPGEQC